MSLFDTDTIIGKTLFVFLIIFIFTVMMKVLLVITEYLVPIFNPATNQHKRTLVSGMHSGKHMIVIPQNPNSIGTIPIFRSIDEKKGIEYSWSVWLFVDGISPDKYKTVFFKGEMPPTQYIAEHGDGNGINSLNNAPGMYLAPNTNELLIIMNTFSKTDERITIPNLPMKKWVHVLMRGEGKRIDVYVNGTVAKSATFTSIPAQNYAPIYICANGGFDGFLSRFVYYNKALNIGEIKEIMKKGPNTNFDSTVIPLTQDKDTSYLSKRWYDDLF
tara:strand:+ start:186 stop:1004 length:819 start_codon:yes stop_codon:yes gene_type:complete